ncbi:hypothetical protein C4D60_Mb04t40140 [Musa balbisiana]|uniref:Uncharacterized protein n=1 Tax=Musa balbisiana TaxID=52838 RepID=A0A4S8KID4_MUSBA|nr:hypothetical protein C4D60_Mb04t40140 [Musa balbisiana]
MPPLRVARSRVTPPQRVPCPCENDFFYELVLFKFEPNKNRVAAKTRPLPTPQQLPGGNRALNTATLSPATTLFLPNSDYGVSSTSDCLPLRRRTMEVTAVSSSGEFLAVTFSYVNGGFCIFLSIDETTSPPPRNIYLSQGSARTPFETNKNHDTTKPRPLPTSQQAPGRTRALNTATLSPAASLFLPDGDCGVSSASGCLPLHRRTAEATAVSSSGEFLAAAFSSVDFVLCVD